MINIDKAKTQKIHTRGIAIATYEGGPDSIVVEGVGVYCGSSYPEQEIKCYSY